MRIREKAMYDKKPVKLIEGISNHLLTSPGKLKERILNPGTTKVTKYKVIADESHLKSPNVIRLRGRRRRFIIGFTKYEQRRTPRPAKRMLVIPFSNIIPDITVDIRYKLSVSII